MSIHELQNGWRVRYRERGTHKSVNFAKSKGYTRQDAVDFEAEKKRDQRMAKLYPGKPPSWKAEEPFEDYVAEWWGIHEGTIKPSTATHYQSVLDNYILPFFEGYRLCDIGIDQVKAFRSALAGEGVGAPTQAKVLMVLGAIFKGAVEGQRLVYNPVSAVKKPIGYRQRVIQPFPPAKVEALRGRLSLEGATLVSVMAYAGARAEEAYARLPWADIGDDFIVLRGDKTNRDRPVRLLAPLRDDLMAWRKESGRAVGQVFGWTNSQYRNWRNRHFKPAALAVGITPARPYDLRHACATLLIQEGNGLGYVAQQLGHSLQVCERWYGHLGHLSASKVDAATAIEAARNLEIERREAK